MIVSDEELAKWEKTFDRKKFEAEILEVLNRYDLPDHLHTMIMAKVQVSVRTMVFHANEMRRQYQEAAFKNWQDAVAYEEEKKRKKLNKKKKKKKDKA